MLAVLGQNVTSVYTCSLRIEVLLSREARHKLFTIYMHGQTSLSTVWVNGTKIQDWLISSPNRVGHLYKSVPFTEKTTYREGLKLVSKMALKKWKKIPVWNISDVPLVPEIFRRNDPESRRFYLLYNRVFRNATSVFINGK